MKVANRIRVEKQGRCEDYRAWLRLIYKSSTEILRYLEEKGVEYVELDQNFYLDDSCKRRLHVEDIAPKFYKQVVEPGVTEIARKYGVKYRFKMESGWREGRGNILTLTWDPMEIDVDV